MQAPVPGKRGQRAKAGEPTARPGRVTQRADRAKKILIAEDDRATRHLIRSVLKGAGFSVSAVADGHRALEQLHRHPFDILLLDVWLPRLNGLDLLARLRSDATVQGHPKVLVMTSDETPEVMLQAVREQAYDYLSKPVEADELIQLVHRTLAAPTAYPIEVVSAQPHWVELLVPCQHEAAERIQGFLGRLKADLAEDVRDAVGQVFRELLLNAIEWGGKLDPTRQVRISYIRAERMLLYRIADPGEGFSFKTLSHAAVANPPESPAAHMEARRQKGLRTGGFGILMARALVDELLYNERQNEVVFVKYLD
jgi:CheY-like chemotaxis protein/anti-sigma regulatory factor (Ser/Thr protein kinase)